MIRPGMGMKLLQNLPNQDEVRPELPPPEDGYDPSPVDLRKGRLEMVRRIKKRYMALGASEREAQEAAEREAARGAEKAGRDLER